MEDEGPLYVPVILGTARVGRMSELAARFMLEQVREFGLETDLIDVRDFRLPATDNTGTTEEAQRFEKIVSRAHALLMVVPEYNRGYPGELKMMLDMLYPQYARKPVAICGVSSGIFGGSRMIQQLKLVCVGLHMIPLEDSIYFSRVQDLFDAQGKIQKESYYRQARKLLEELVWHAQACRMASKISEVSRERI